MSAVLEAGDPIRVLARMHADLDQLQALDLTGYTDEALEGYWREVERLRRRLPSLDHALLLETEARGLPYERAVRTMRAYLRGLLRLDPQEADGRVRAAAAAGRRHSITGTRLDAPYEAVAVAQDTGTISERHALVIRKTVDALPGQVRDEHGPQLAAQLVEHAECFDPTQLARIARRLGEHLDPDGTLTDSDYRHSQRDLTVRQRPDGSSSGTFELTAEATELLLTHFDAYAAPQPAADGVKDPRTAGQRRHDALAALMKANLRAQMLPTVAGVSATLIATMTTDQYLTGHGLARTSHGALVPTRDILDWAAGDYRLFLTVHDTINSITHHSSTRRLFTENQRLTLIARDQGCTFPNCPMPPAWCETDHTIDHAHGGPTSIDNAALACDYDNRERKKQGWKPIHLNGRIAWTPPKWIDPQQRPRYNLLHNTDPPP